MMTEKFDINLLSPELLPEQPLITLKRVVSIWMVVLAVMVSLSVMTGYQKDSLVAKSKRLSSQHQLLESQSETLKERVTNRTTDPQLEAELSSLKLIMRNKQALHGKLTDPNQTYVAGFANSMTELANYHHKDISLTQVIIKPEHVQFSGLARRPEAVPVWLSGFEKSTLLSGQEFKQMKLEEDEQKVTHFTISSDEIIAPTKSQESE